MMPIIKRLEMSLDQGGRKKSKSEKKAEKTKAWGRNRITTYNLKNQQ
jgi:hypothetical protein